LLQPATHEAHMRNPSFHSKVGHLLPRVAGECNEFGTWFAKKKKHCDHNQSS